MSSSEPQTSSSSSGDEIASENSEQNELECIFTPYIDDPLADEEWSDGEDNEDADGLTPAILERRYNETDLVEKWCICRNCNTTYLDSALEYRCCKEVQPVLNLLWFEGRGDTLCITKHPDFFAMTNSTVLKNVVPLFTNKEGKRYGRLDRRSENDLLRATAYRWITRWICGYLGWENSRPLPACVYHHVRTTLKSHNVTGYATSRERNN